MDFLRKLFKDKDKKTAQSLALMAALGIILLIMSKTLFKSSNNQEDKILNETKEEDLLNNETDFNDYEDKVEKKLKALLSKVEGVGNVEVMVTVSYSSEIVMAEDKSSNEVTTTETDSQGGTRENSNKTTDNKTIIIQSPGGGQTPIIVKEIVPKIEGVIIVAEGGENVLVKQALINSAVTVLGVEPHKVQVLKMKSK